MDKVRLEEIRHSVNSGDSPVDYFWELFQEVERSMETKRLPNEEGVGKLGGLESIRS